MDSARFLFRCDANSRRRDWWRNHSKSEYQQILRCKSLVSPIIKIFFFIIPRQTLVFPDSNDYYYFTIIFCFRHGTIQNTIIRQNDAMMKLELKNVYTNCTRCFKCYNDIWVISLSKRNDVCVQNCKSGVISFIHAPRSEKHQQPSRCISQVFSFWTLYKDKINEY